MKKKAIYLIYLASFICITSCEKFVDTPIPPNQLSQNNSFENENSVEAVFAGIYSNLSNLNHRLNAEMQIALGLSSNELYYSGNEQKFDQFQSRSILPTNSTVGDTWSNTFSSIYNVNAAIEGLSSSATLNVNLKSQYIAEAKFLRAFFYFFLINLYGDVPLVIGTDYQVNSTFPRTPVEEVYQQIIGDLIDAKAGLAGSILNPDRTRPSYYSASALLARVYLYLERYPEAEEQTSELIQQDIFELSSATDVFKKVSKETIWQLSSVSPNYNTNIGRLLVPPSLTNDIIPTFQLSEKFAIKFEDSDERLATWTGNKMINGKDYFFPYKYQIQSGNTITEYLVIFRLAEMYLIRAEARAYLGQISESLEDLNVVHRRSAKDDLQASSFDDLINLIINERRRELFCEWGLTWFDLKRSDKTNNESAGENRDWQNPEGLWPIPLKELELNPSLTQNNGY